MIDLSNRWTQLLERLPGLSNEVQGTTTQKPGKGRHLIPLGQTPGSGFLPWILALMGFLGCLALAAVIGLTGLADRWQESLGVHLTVEIDPLHGVPAEQDGRLQQVLDSLAGIAGVEAAIPLSRETQAEALEPWLDDPTLIESLNLPALIELRLADGAQGIDPASLEATLQANTDGVRVTEPGPLLTDLLQPARLVESFAYAIMFAVFVASMLLAAFSARAALFSHVRLISLLHLIGATDQDIASEIQWHIMRRGGIGAVSGLLAAIIVLAVTASLMADGWPSYLPKLQVDAALVLGILLFPAILVLLAVLTARLTVIRELARHA
jgi:cell division transport system permease protein